MIDNGRLSITAAELADFTSLAEIEPVARHWWLINTTTGQTRIERDPSALPDSGDWLLLMTGPTPAWVQQWDGDLQRAVDEQLNPLLEAAMNYSTGEVTP
ncbi:hypothetical protein [Prescottella equi]|uniref:hypothetical protein n=1 Tax=Rhodococcus hoagii TaxID=43767 RepID=UPI000A60D347|nr:hypothetical protein [Prescottella equi]